MAKYNEYDLLLRRSMTAKAYKEHMKKQRSTVALGKNLGTITMKNEDRNHERAIRKEINLYV